MTKELNWLGKLPVGSTVYCVSQDRRFSSREDRVYQIVKQGRAYTTLQPVFNGRPGGHEVRVRRNDIRYPLIADSNVGLGLSVYTSLEERESHMKRLRLLRAFEIKLGNLAGGRNEIPDEFAIRAAANIMGISLEETRNG